MNGNFIRIFYNPLLAAGGVAAGAQTILGIVQAIQGQKNMKKYSSLLKAYEIPQEIFDIGRATASRASSGFSPETLSYMTGEVDRGFGSAVGAATRLGADPNELSALLDQKIEATMKIGAANQLENMKNFERYLSANQLLADNKAARQKSQQDLIKDKLQAAGYNKMAGLQNIIGGVNTGLSTLSSAEIMKLYRDSGLGSTGMDALSNLPPPNNVPAEQISGSGRATSSIGSRRFMSEEEQIRNYIESLNRRQ